MRIRSIVTRLSIAVGGALIGFLVGVGHMHSFYSPWISEGRANSLSDDIGHLVKLRNGDVDRVIAHLELKVGAQVPGIISEATDRQGRFHPERLSEGQLRALQWVRSYMEAGFVDPFSSDDRERLSQVTSRTPRLAELEGQRARDFTVDQLRGGQFTLSKATDRVIVHNFWATWCGPCLAALPAYAKVHQWAKARGESVSIYCVNVKEDPDKIREFCRKKAFSVPVLMDRDGEVAKAYKAEGIPLSVIICDGTIAYAKRGIMAGDEEDLRTRIEALLRARETE